MVLPPNSEWATEGYTFVRKTDFGWEAWRRRNTEGGHLQNLLWDVSPDRENALRVAKKLGNRLRRMDRCHSS